MPDAKMAAVIGRSKTPQYLSTNVGTSSTSSAIVHPGGVALLRLCLTVPRRFAMRLAVHSSGNFSKGAKGTMVSNARGRRTT